MSFSEWREVRLGDVCTYASTKVSVSEVSEDNYISTENMLPNKSGVTKSSGLPTVGSVTKYSAGNVLVSNIRPYFRKIWYADRDGGCSNDVLVFDINDSKTLDSKFLFYCLSNDVFFDYVMAGSKGTKMPRGDKGAIMKYPVLLPSLPEQKAIAATLSALDDMIELNNQINKTLEEMAQAIFKSWFVDFEPFKDGESEESEIGLIPKGWKIVELEEICSIQNGFAFKSSDYQDTGCRLIRTTNITSNGYVNNNDIKFLPQSFYESEKYKNYRFECFDTVLVMVGASIGKIGLITEYNLPSLQNQNMWRFRANNREISSVYIHYVVRRVNEFVSNWATGSARDFYRKESFQRAKCVLPPKNVMKEFRLLTDSLFIQISSNIMENALLLEIRDILLPKLMSGEIRVPVEEVV